MKLSLLGNNKYRYQVKELTAGNSQHTQKKGSAPNIDMKI